jgi:hypothetical protein
MSLDPAEIHSLDGFETKDTSPRPHEARTGLEPFAQVERRPRHRDVVIAARMIVDAFGASIEVGQG